MSPKPPTNIFDPRNHPLSTNPSPNTALWFPPQAASLAFQNATTFTRLGTLAPHVDIMNALRATPAINQTFCISINNVVLVFSASYNQHTADVAKVREMLSTCGIDVDVNHDCVFNSATSGGVGVRMEEVVGGAWVVVNEGVEGRKEGTGPDGSA